MKLLGYIALLVVLSAVGYSIYVLAPRLGEWGPQQTDDGVSMTMESVSEYTDTYSIKAQYQQFGIPAVDALVKKTVEEAIANFKTYPANPPDSAVTQNEFIGIIGSTYVGADVVSVQLIFSEYTGGAHPNATIVGITVDRKTGKELTLDDALAMTGLSLEQVVAESLKQLKTTLGEGVIFEEGTSAKPENYSTFVVSADKVTFIFQNYQVAAYAAGPQEVGFARVK